MPARRCSMRTEEGWRGSPIRSHLRCTEVHAQNARSRPSRDPPSRRPAKAVQIMNVMFSASRPAAGLRSMPRQPRGSTDSSARARPLRGREEHQDRQILQDIVEPVFGAGGDEHDAPWTDLAILSSHPNSRGPSRERDRKSTRLNSSHGYISYAVFCLKKKNEHVLYPFLRPPQRGD